MQNIPEFESDENRNFFYKIRIVLNNFQYSAILIKFKQFFFKDQLINKNLRSLFQELRNL